LVALKFKEKGDFTKPFVLGDLTNVHLHVKTQEKQEEKEEMIKLQPKSTDSMELLNNIPQLKALGKPFKVTPKVQLTDIDSDYIVECIKYVYKKNIVFQFDCVNKVDDRLLENVGVNLDFKFDGIEEDFQAKASSIPFNSTGTIFVCCDRTDDSFAVGKVFVELTFNYKVVDPSTGEVVDDEEIADEYLVEKLELNISDYSRNTTVEDFKEKWTEMGEENDTSGSLTIKASSLQDSVDKFIDAMDLNALNDTVVSKKTHGLFFSGEYSNLSENVVALVSVKFAEKDGKFGSTISVRSPSKELRQIIPPYLKKSLSK
jgi:coatomer subunit gamma